MNNQRALVMENLIKSCMRCKPDTIRVTQDLSDLKNVSNDMVNAIMRNCTVFINLPKNAVHSGVTDEKSN